MKDINHAIMQHDLVARSLIKKILTHGDDNASAVISHTIEMIDNEAILKTSIDILPIRRIYKDGARIIDDDALTYETQEEWLV